MLHAPDLPDCDWSLGSEYWSLIGQYLSELNLPLLAMLCMAISAHLAVSWYTELTMSEASGDDEASEASADDEASTDDEASADDEESKASADDEASEASADDDGVLLP